MHVCVHFCWDRIARSPIEWRLFRTDTQTRNLQPCWPDSICGRMTFQIWQVHFAVFFQTHDSLFPSSLSPASWHWQKTGELFTRSVISLGNICRQLRGQFWHALMNEMEYLSKSSSTLLGLSMESMRRDLWELVYSSWTNFKLRAQPMHRSIQTGMILSKKLWPILGTWHHSFRSMAERVRAKEREKRETLLIWCQIEVASSNKKKERRRWGTLGSLKTNLAIGNDNTDAFWWPITIKTFGFGPNVDWLKKI